MKKIVFFTGAGISKASGISTFRDSNGLWENYSIEEVATPLAWLKNQELVQSFYNLRRKQIIENEPNSAHKSIYLLENEFEIEIITQNIDDFHERSGSTNVLHLHGNIRFAKSSGPNQEKKYYPIEGWELTSTDVCDDGFPLRPHVVWFGEDVPMLEHAKKIIETADILVVIGTSLQVYPAASLIHFCSMDCVKYVIDPNISATSLPKGFELIQENAIYGMYQLTKLLTDKR